jgi:hypothetical protein
MFAHPPSLAAAGVVRNPLFSDGLRIKAKRRASFCEQKEAKKTLLIWTVLVSLPQS